MRLEHYDILPAETVAWSVIDHHQWGTEFHAELTDVIRRARNDTANAAYKIATRSSANFGAKADATKAPSFYAQETAARCIADTILADLVSATAAPTAPVTE